MPDLGQAKSGKQNLAELAIVLLPEEERLQDVQEVDRYKKEKADIKLAAEKLEADVTRWDKQSDDQMNLHHRWAQATTALQVSITLAAMALLTRRKWLEYGMFGVTGSGCAGRPGDAAYLNWASTASFGRKCLLVGCPFSKTQDLTPMPPDPDAPVGGCWSRRRVQHTWPTTTAIRTRLACSGRFRLPPVPTASPSVRAPARRC